MTGRREDETRAPAYFAAMPDAHEFLQNLALVLGVAAVATVAFQRLRLPVVFGYLLAGLIIGPHIPVPLVADEATVHTLAELGVILVMFSLGLEFSLRKLLQVGATSGFIALAETSAMVGIGFGLGRLFGWTTVESLYAGAIIAISSTTIIVRAFNEQGVRGRAADIVFGVLVFEDMIAIFMLVAFTAVASAEGISAGTLGVTAMRLATFLAGLIGIGLLVVPRFMRMIVRLDRPETTLVASVGICFASALLALSFGYSVALGAFLAGSLIAESGAEKAVEELVRPVRDMFAAIFFVSVGMLIDPVLVGQHWVAVVAFTIAVIVGKFVAVSASAFLSGVDTRTAVQAGMSQGQIGEFSFIIAGVGLAAAATRPFLYPVAIAVSAITALTTPWMIRSAGPTAAYVDRTLPRRLQTFVALYGSWIERMRAAPREPANRSRVRRMVRLLLLDAVALAAIAIGVGLETVRLGSFLARLTGLSEQTSRIVVVMIGIAVAAPILFGLVATARRLSLALAHRALPGIEKGKVDFAAAPRRALVVTLQIAIVLAVGVPLVAVTQPFLPPLRGVAVLVAIVILLGVAFWRSTANLHGHAKAGAEVIASVLAQHLNTPGNEERAARAKQLDTILPGLGHPVPVHLDTGSNAVGKTLAELNVRGMTGATILAISRDGTSILIPSGHEVLKAGDVIALAGSHEAVNAATQQLAARSE